MSLMHSDPQFAPVAPIQILEKMLAHDPKKLFGNYHLLLAHHVAENAERFTKLWSDYFKTIPYKQPMVIMDNSIVELGGAVDDQMMVASTDAVRAGTWRGTVIPVLPDVMGDGLATTELTIPAYHRWLNLPTLQSDGFMLVTQGANWGDFTDLVNYFFVDKKEDYRKITWVGIPRRLMLAGISRKRAIKYITMVAPWVNIHLLGFSFDIAEDFQAARLDIKQVQGIDSAVPVRFKGILTPTMSDSAIGGRGDWWEKGDLEPINIRNINTVRSWLQ